jgi:hypothetical protein
MPYGPPSMELTWNGWVSIWNRNISSATRWTRNRLISGAMLSGCRGKPREGYHRFALSYEPGPPRA